MNKNALFDLFEAYPEADTIQWEGPCHDCGEIVTVIAALVPEGDGIEMTGGAVYDLRDVATVEDEFKIKCDACFEKEKSLVGFQPTECYSRVVGYLRPVKQFNPGKQAEYKDRKMFDVEGL